MNIPNGLKRSCLATKILKIQTVEKSAKLAVLENSHDLSATVANFQNLPIWHFFSTAWILKIFVAKKLLFRSFGIFIKHIG